MQAPVAAPQLPAPEGVLRVSGLTLAGEAGTKLIDGVSFEVGLDQHVAILGSHAAGAGELTQMMARLIVPSSGRVEVGGVDVTRAPESVTGRALAYVGPAAYLFPVSVRDNLLYGLRHYPLREASYEGEALKEYQFQAREEKRTDSTQLDFNADWTDYAAAGATGPEDIDARIVEILKTVELEETIFELGLRSAVDAGQSSGPGGERAARARGDARAPCRARHGGAGGAVRRRQVQPQCHAGGEPAVRHADRQEDLRHRQPGAAAPMYAACCARKASPTTC